MFQREIVPKKRKNIYEILTKLRTKHHLMNRTKVCSKKWPHPLPRGDKYEIVKLLLQNHKKFFSRIPGLISTKLGTKFPLVKGIQVCSIEGPLFSRADNYEIAKKKIKYLLQNHGAKFNQTWQKASLGDRDLALFQREIIMK